jgi:hypothetical protein
MIKGEAKAEDAATMVETEKEEATTTTIVVMTLQGQTAPWKTTSEAQEA